MASKVTPKTALTVFKIMTLLSFAWPLPKNASRFQVIRFKILRFYFFVNVILLILPALYTLYRNDYNFTKIMKIWCMIPAYIQAPVALTQCALQTERLQNLISEMESNFKCAGGLEKEVYQRYTDKCALFYAIAIWVVFITALGLSIISPFLTPDQTFPTDVKYPFDVNHQPLKTFIFLNQFFAVWQACSNCCFCYFVGFMIWFSAARFEILSQQFRVVKNNKDIIACILQHIKLLRYSQELISAVRSVLLTMISICTVVTIASGLIIVGQNPLGDKVQFIILCLTGFLEVYTCTWPADHLMDASTSIGRAAYETLWYDQDVIFQKYALFILLRSQTPVVVSASSVLPPLSLNYYASYVSTAFSYLMTLRIALMEDNAIKN